MVELLYVLQGELILDLSDRSLCLHAGQSLSYPSDQPYTYRNAGDVTTEFIRNVTL